MTHKDIVHIISEAADAIGCKYTYRQWPVGAAPNPPYILFYYPGQEPFAADDEIYVEIPTLHVELYTDNKDFNAEAKLEAALIRNGLIYEKHESYIDEEHMYEVLYQMEVMLHGN